MPNLTTPDPAQLNWNAVERESESSILLQTHLQGTGPVFFQWESNKFVSFYKRLTSHVTTVYGGICFCPLSLGTSWCCQNNFWDTFHIEYLIFIAYWKFNIQYVLHTGSSRFVAHWKLNICCTLKNWIFLANWKFNICCKLKIQYVLQIESSRCGAQWKFEMYSTSKMSPRPFPLLRINSLFHLLRIAIAAAACSDLSTWQKKTTLTKNVN